MLIFIPGFLAGVQRANNELRLLDP